MVCTQLGFFLLICLLISWLAACGSVVASDSKQKINQYFRYDEKSDKWVPVELPYDLITCVNGNCTVVGSIREAGGRGETRTSGGGGKGDEFAKNDSSQKAQVNYRKLLPLRKRISLTKMSDTSVWITGESGSIYERFWNGEHWVIAPHDLPSSAGPAVSVFIVNQTILALSEAGFLYQMQLTDNVQLVWRVFAAPPVDQNADTELEHSRVKAGVVTKHGERIYFCTKNGSLIELLEAEPPRWVNHGQPPGADVAVIADAGTMRPNRVFTISSAGELYEHDKDTKPPWKKHVRRQGSGNDTLLIPSRGCTAQGLSGASSVSLFLLTKAGELIERRLHQRKWKWISHGTSDDELLTSITPVIQDESSEKHSMFLTTAAGSVLEYQIAKQSGMAQEQQIEEPWINHQHPPHTKLARGISGTPFQFGRVIYPLDDGRLAELHISGLGGENSGPAHQVNFRKRMLIKYSWSVLDAPETEGWNAEYCTEERGPFNCMMGVKDEANGFTSTRSLTRRQKGTQLSYLIPDSSTVSSEKSLTEHKFSEQWVNDNFRIRVMQGGRSFFLVTDYGMTFEYLYHNEVGLWLGHEHPTPMNGAVGSYNGSLFLVDIHGNLLIRERINNELQWINCTAMKRGKQIISGPPWDRIYGTSDKISASNALYFVSKNGRLLQFTVGYREFKWKDCKKPGNTKIATIVDQEMLRDKVVFATGRNGQLYQYNTLSGRWHEHHQSQHLILSRLPGTSMRLSTVLLEGSLFMISEDGGLVEYHWNSADGWMWVEHGTPDGTVRFIGAPGPSFYGRQLFLVGSDGKVYLRYSDQGEWKWRDYGFPGIDHGVAADTGKQTGFKHQNKGVCANAGGLDDTEDLKLCKTNSNCDPKVSYKRPIPSASDKVIFELRDGRLAEMHRVKDFEWIWLKIIATPTSVCMASFWAGGVS